MSEIPVIPFVRNLMKYYIMQRTHNEHDLTNKYLSYQLSVKGSYVICILPRCRNEAWIGTAGNSKQHYCSCMHV